MNLITIENTQMGQNVYLYYNEETKDAICIDPGGNAAGVCDALDANGLRLGAIILTHGHYDHIGAAQELRAHSGAPIYCHGDDAEMLEEAKLNLSSTTSDRIAFSPDKLLVDGEDLAIGNAKLRIIHTPGHTRGGLCLYDVKNAALFTGDTLFKNSIGRTDLHGGNHAQLIDSIKSKLLILPADTRVYPGHGPASTIGGEIKNNQFLN
jgi:glyoxylase-like metal-dependent hydrolase (beta-lactamase superfamily II)